MGLRARIQAQLDRLSCEYAFYYRKRGQPPIVEGTQQLFLAASLIKVPILYAWAHLERLGEVSREELCDLDAEPQVQGAGLSWLLRARHLPYHDVLLLMIALSDNLCTNLVIRRLGIERLNAIFRGPLGLRDTVLERRLMDYEARSRGLENRISARDAIRLFDLRDALGPEERAWTDTLLLANDDLGLLLRELPRDVVAFHHKTGSIPGLLHDWGYTDAADIYLLTQEITDVRTTYDVFGRLGALLLGREEEAK